MMTQKLFKQLEVWVTEWQARSKMNEFLKARLKLTLYYSVIAIVILGSSSVLLYNTILSNLTQSILENIFLNPNVAQGIIDRARDILLNRFITIDAIIIFFIVILSFLLTEKTLEPIEVNMEKQKRFIADASHELRTPTAVVISLLEVTLNNKKLDFIGAKKALESTLEEMREFSNLSNTLLDLSKYDTSVKVEHEYINIPILVKSIVEKSKNLAFSSKGINMKTDLIDLPFNIKGNKVELCRVFYNVFDNAIKYSPPGGVIKVDDKISSDKYIITITDSGMGMPGNILNRIFDPFFRGDKSRTTTGVGLGLTLAKRIIEDHEGTIFIKSQLHEGTTVIISLPASS